MQQDQKRSQEVQTPCVASYNKHMKGVDKKDQKKEKEWISGMWSTSVDSVECSDNIRTKYWQEGELYEIYSQFSVGSLCKVL
jgi:hypothetical protein